MKLSLARKFSLLIAMPLVALLLFGAFTMQQNWSRKKMAEGMKADAEFFLATSALIHETQKERGKSALYLGGKLNVSEVQDQRRSVDQKLAVYSEMLRHVEFQPGERQQAEAVLSNIRDVRKTVDDRTESRAATAAYGQIIMNLITLEVAVTRLHSMDGIETTLLSLTNLEVAKEDAGRLRALITGILSFDNPIGVEQLKLIDSLKAGVTANIDSPALTISPEGRRDLTKFQNLDDWKFVLETQETVARKASSGQYAIDATTFFNAITRSIDALAEIVADELNVVMRNANETSSRSAYAFSLIAFFLGALSCLVAVISWRVIRRLSSRLETIAGMLSAGADEVASAATEISSSSETLSQSATEQAAALQETAASVEEMSAMVKKNADNASHSQEISQDSESEAHKGKQVVDDMIRAINEINSSNVDIMKQIEASNAEIAEIVKVISEIGQKTQVINDIVFQTKLLSFNASVEAARAGEHGKGFAVVAEEVGNLAQMSGKAAKEISSLLEGSIQKVDGIVKDTKVKVENLVGIGRSKVEAGTTVAKRCGEVLESLVRNVGEVNRMVAEISTATREQAAGVQEITKAMGQLDQVTQQNAAASNQAASASGQLATQAELLRGSVEELLSAVEGEEKPRPDEESVAAIFPLQRASKPRMKATQEVGRAS